MATNSGAYYEGLQYANQGVEPVNFGELAMGYAKIREDQRLEAKRDKERREATQMEMTKLFGEEIYSAFDGTGLKDADIFNSKLKDTIVTRAGVINSMYEKGQITAPQMMQQMAKLSSHSKKYASAAASLSSKMEQFNKLGDKASRYSQLMIQKLDGAMNLGAPAVDSDSNLLLLSKDGDQITTSPFSEIEKLIDIREAYDVNTVVDSVVRSKAKQKIVKNGKVIERYADVGDSDRSAFANIVTTLDDADKFDIADRLGVPVKVDPNSVFRIVNEEEVSKAIVDRMMELAQNKLEQYVAVDEVEAAKLGIQQSQEARAKKAAEMSVVNVVKDDQGNVIETQVSPAPGKTASVRSLLIGSKTIPVANIGKLVVDENTGAHRVTISYEVPIDAPVPAGAEVAPALQKLLQQGEKQTKIITEEVALTDPAVINQVRAQLDMSQIKVSTSKPKPY